ncbi:uncharacterized protein N7483_001046 [Penicillium malachiteum]|uniref:uncharacterized protein n=1 Tax=Penicillium malachiteum TaxID=1324776 RepID=UPI002546B17A|nr:uncharacterized protein N7483_001046 [Penicillium malachiteum]KAJ5735921.1 hypothetical protein N7483_001046 [Penicillium malachiteum]
MENFGNIESGEPWVNDSSRFSIVQASPESAERVKRVRIRVSHACDRCKRRKIRCTGNRPCSFCAREATRCIYTVPNKRGRKSRAGNSDNQELNSSNNSRRAVPLESNARTEEENSHSASGTDLDDFEVNNTLIERSPLGASPDATTDHEGQYVGPASGLSFLARVQKRLHNTQPTSSSFTFGDAPMAEYDPVPSIMISPEESSRLVKTFFEFTIPIDRIIHRRTIEEWLEQFQQTLGAMRDVENAPAQRAMLWMIFAMAQEHKTEFEAEKAEDKSRRTFWSAYCLDTHLSLTLGRPKIFHDEDIDQELPSGIDDLSVHMDILAPARSSEYSTMIAPVAYYK